MWQVRLKENVADFQKVAEIYPPPLLTDNELLGVGGVFGDQSLILNFETY